jgi:ATP-dependent helicase/nuclease subunit B
MGPPGAESEEVSTHSIQARRVFLGWDGPLLARTVAWLASGWDGASALDLRSSLLVVSTRQSGRRLRAALASHAAARGRAVLAPRVVLPEQVIDLAGGDLGARAGRPEVLGADRAGLTALLPVKPPVRDFEWALSMAGSMLRLQEILGEGGLRFADVPARGGEDLRERDRWQQLAELEQGFDRVLAARNLVAPAAFARDAARQPRPPPEGTERLVFLAVPDPRPASLAIAEAWSQRIEVIAAVLAPDSLAERFDRWGRPDPDAWSGQPILLRDPESCLHVCASPRGLAARIASIAGGYGRRVGMLAVASADPELDEPIAGALAESGLTGFLPGGEPLAAHSVCGLLYALMDAAFSDGWEGFVQVARRSEILAWLADRPGGVRPEALLEGIDALHAENLPVLVQDGIRHARGGPLAEQYPGLGGSLGKVRRLLRDLRDGPFPNAWNAVLGELFKGRSLESASAEGRAFREAAEAWRDASSAAALVPGLGTREAVSLAMELLRTSRHYPEKPDGAVEIDGWLELPFRDEPHLAIAGLHEGSVPSSVTGHAFLPEALRSALGLRTNEHRLARDAWQLSALAASRAQAGRLEILLSRTSAGGDPRSPSRLLFHCTDSDLPARVRQVFGEPPPEGKFVAWQRAWKLRPPAPREFRKLSVTAFRDYLRCPFRFYLKHSLRMQAVDAGKRELDAFDFGRLVHSVLERLGRDEDWRESRDAERLAREFCGELDQLVADRFGKRHPLPLVIQIESARQRLRQAAGIQAAEREAGWVIRDTEWRFPAEGLQLAGLAVSGTIDRIEQNERNGAWRVLDYKTSETGVEPRLAHLAGGRRRDRPSVEEAEVDVDGSAFFWIDLQLPLYRWALERVRGLGDVEIGYFNLPKGVASTTIAIWPEFQRSGLGASAIACGQAIAARILERRFGPPAEPGDLDPFESLFHEGVAASIEEFP